MFGKNAKETRPPLFIHGEQEQPCKLDTAEKCRRLFQLQQQRKAMEQEEKALREDLDKLLDTDDKIVLPGECQVMKVASNRLEVTDPDRLREILGPRFDDLVHVATTYKLEERLKQMLEDGDDPAGQAALEVVNYRESTALRCTAA